MSANNQNLPHQHQQQMPYQQYPQQQQQQFPQMPYGMGHGMDVSSSGVGNAQHQPYPGQPVPGNMPMMPQGQQQPQGQGISQSYPGQPMHQQQLYFSSAYNQQMPSQQQQQQHQPEMQSYYPQPVTGQQQPFQQQQTWPGQQKQEQHNAPQQQQMPYSGAPAPPFDHTSVQQPMYGYPPVPYGQQQQHHHHHAPYMQQPQQMMQMPPQHPGARPPMYPGHNQYMPYPYQPQIQQPYYGAPPAARGESKGLRKGVEKSNVEVPGRKLFIRNFPFDTPHDELQKVFAPFGDIKEFFALSDRKGMAFVTYYDIRDAKRALQTILEEKMQVGGRNLDVHYSLPKDEDMQSRQCDRDKNQGTLLITFKDSEQPLDDAKLKEHFGKLKSFKILRPYKQHANQRFVEFFDSRDCQKAYDDNNLQPWQDGHLDMRFAWDIPLSKRADGGYAAVDLSKKSSVGGGSGSRHTSNAPASRFNRQPSNNRQEKTGASGGGPVRDHSQSRRREKDDFKPYNVLTRKPQQSSANQKNSVHGNDSASASQPPNIPSSILPSQEEASNQAQQLLANLQQSQPGQSQGYLQVQQPTQSNLPIDMASLIGLAQSSTSSAASSSVQSPMTENADSQSKPATYMSQLLQIMQAQKNQQQQQQVDRKNGSSGDRSRSRDSAKGQADDGDQSPHSNATRNYSLRSKSPAKAVSKQSQKTTFSPSPSGSPNKSEDKEAGSSTRSVSVERRVNSIGDVNALVNQLLAQSQRQK
ncbi:hypothetical protein MP228_006808 [Amoeboaphelidium protococcarum]|nr:hypothetical protein MP228_006808 [Amoeboaphelidium protococcarum]